MTKQHFSFKEIFTFGWAKTKQHAWFAFLTFIIISIIIGSVKMTPFISDIVSLLALISVVSISILIVRDQHFTFADLVNPLLSYKRVLKFFAVTVLLSIPALVLVSPFITGILFHNGPMASFGSLLLIPLVYFCVRLKFFPFVVVEHENLSVVELIKASYRLTGGYFWTVFTFLVLVTIFNIVGAVFFLVGLIITVPTSLFATTYFYEKLKNHHTA